MTNDYLLPRKRVADFFGVSPDTVDNWRKASKLPEPERLPSGRPAWRLSVLNQVVQRATAEAA